MSHHGTNWAISQRGLKPATKIVLWHLADCHNPSLGCFPSQTWLASACEMARSTVNEHLAILEKRGLIRREQKVDKDTKRQLETRYYLAFEEDFAPKAEPQDVVVPCPDSGQGSVSGKSPEPCPEKAPSRVRIPDTNPVKEPVKEPRGRAASARWEEGFSRFWDSWPALERPEARHQAANLFRNLSEEARDVAARLVPTYLELMRKRRKPPRMMPYLRNRLFIELDGAPEFDDDGDFIITPSRPEEWSQWMGAIRSEHGQRGVDSAVRQRLVVRKTRWPEPQKAAAA